MITPQLLTYIIQQLDQGMDKETIKNALFSIGWQEVDINSAFLTIGSQASSLDKSPPSPSQGSEDFSNYFAKKQSTRGGWKAVQYYQETNAPKIIQLLMKYSGGMIKTETQATITLSIFIVVCLVASITLSYQYYFKLPGSGIPSGKICNNPPTCDK